MVDFSKLSKAKKINKGLYAIDNKREGIEDFFSPNNLTSLFTGFDVNMLNGLNAGQVTMVKDLVSYLEDPNDPREYFTVYGGPGTGKSFAIKRAISHINLSRFIAAAPSHFAKNVLKDFLGEDFKVTTTASMLGKILKYVEGKAILVDNPKYHTLDPPIYTVDVVLIDEISMVDDDQARQVLEDCRGKKLIVMGDYCQLPPVGQHTDSLFFENISAELTVSMRFTGNIRDLVVAVRGEILCLRKGLVPNINIINHITDRRSKIDKKGSGYIFLNSEALMLRSATLRFKEHKGINYARIVAFRNETVERLTLKIRKNLFGAAPKQFEKDEILISDGGFTVQNKSIINNGEIFKVRKAVAVDGPYNIKCMELFFEGRNFERSILTVAKEDKLKYTKLLMRLKRAAKADKENWRHYHKLMESFAHFSYAYVLTSHKVQGSSIKYVYVLEDDILGVKPTTVKEKLQSLNVAISRASFRVYIFNKKYKIDYTNLNKEHLKLKPDENNRT